MKVLTVILGLIIHYQALSTPNIKSLYDSLYVTYQSTEITHYPGLIAKAEVFLDEAKAQGDDFYIAKGHFLVGFLHKKLGAYAPALLNYLETEHYVLNLDDQESQELLTKVYKNTSNIFFIIQSYEMSRDFLDKALKVAKRINYSKELLFLNEQKIVLHRAEKDFQSVMQLSDSLLQLASGIPLDLQSFLYFQKALSYSNMGEFDLALQNYQKVLDNRSYMYHENYRSALLNSVVIYRDRFMNYDMALRACNEFLKLFGDHHKLIGLAYKASCYYKKGEYDSALIFYNRAINQGLDSSLQQSFLIYNELALTHKKLGRTDSALHYHELYVNGSNSWDEKQREILDIHLKNSIEQIALRYFDLKEAQDKQASLRRNSDAQTIILVILILLMSMSMAFILLRQRHKKNLASQALRDLDALSDLQ